MGTAHRTACLLAAAVFLFAGPPSLHAAASPAVQKLVRKLHSPNVFDRASAAFDPGTMGKEAAGAVPDLIGLLRDRTLVMQPVHEGNHSATRAGTCPGTEAIDALGDIGDPRAVPPLIDHLRDRSDEVRKHAASALHDITRRNFGQNAATWQAWWDKNRAKFH